VLLAAVAFSLVPTTRHEGILLLPAVAVLLAWRGGCRGWLAIPLLLSGELAWNIAKPLLGYPWNELPILRFATKGEPGHLGVGGPLHYVAASTRAFGPVQAALGVIGSGLLLWRFRGQSYAPRRATAIVCGGGTLGLLLVQTYLYMVNTHESGGYARFLIPAAPWAAVGVAMAGGVMLDVTRRGRTLLASAIAGFAATAMVGLAWNGWSLWWGVAPALLPIAGWVLLRPDAVRVRQATVVLALLAVGIWIGNLRPHPLLDHQRLVIQTYRTMTAEHPDALVSADNPWADHAAGVPRSPFHWASSTWRAPPAGRRVIYLWDANHSKTNLPMAELLSFPHERLALPEVPVLESRPADDPLRNYLRVFDRINNASPGRGTSSSTATSAGGGIGYAGPHGRPDDARDSRPQADSLGSRGDLR
jgi:hypothetical protein